jgi:competence protein ComEA
MLRSLLVKLAMLAVTMGAVFWIGWSVPNTTGQSQPQPVDPPEAVVSAQAIQPAAPSPVVNKKTSSQPRKQEPSSRPPSVSAPVQPALPTARQVDEHRLDLNRATVEELERLPGLGPVLAQRVVDRRTAIGSFSSVDDLLDVKGIGRKKMDRVRSFVMAKARLQPGRQAAQTAQPEKGKL